MLRSKRLCFSCCILCLLFMSSRGYAQDELEVYLLADDASKTTVLSSQTMPQNTDAVVFVTDQTSLESSVVQSITPLSGAAAVAGLGASWVSQGRMFPVLSKALRFLSAKTKLQSVLLYLASGAVVAGYLVKGLTPGSGGLGSSVMMHTGNRQIFLLCKKTTQTKPYMSLKQECFIRQKLWCIMKNCKNGKAQILIILSTMLL